MVAMLSRKGPIHQGSIVFPSVIPQNNLPFYTHKSNPALLTFHCQFQADERISALTRQFNFISRNDPFAWKRLALLDEFQRSGIHAIPKPARWWTVVENMSE